MQLANPTTRGVKVLSHRHGYPIFLRDLKKCSHPYGVVSHLPGKLINYEFNFIKSLTKTKLKFVLQILTR